MSGHGFALIAAAHHAFGVGESHLTPAVEGAALLMIGILAFLLGTIACCMWRIARRARQAPQPEALLIEEIARRPDAAPTRPSWERPPDWWH